MIEAKPSHFNELILVPQFFGASVGPVHCTSTYQYQACLEKHGQDEKWSQSYTLNDCVWTVPTLMYA